MNICPVIGDIQEKLGFKVNIGMLHFALTTSVKKNTGNEVIMNICPVIVVTSWINSVSKIAKTCCTLFSSSLCKNTRSESLMNICTFIGDNQETLSFKVSEHIRTLQTNINITYT